jgi:membrane associated rhomboid family serine protease
MPQFLPPATRAILFANVFAYLAEQLFGAAFYAPFQLWPLGPDFEPWQLVTYSFLHDAANFNHIFFNMFGLLMFGPMVEERLGPRRFAVFYFVCVIAAAATQLAVQSATGSPEPTVGASGAIFGILLAAAVFFPRAPLLVFFVLPMPMWLVVTLYGAIELYLGVTGRQEGVAHFAHLGGMMGAAAVILFWRTRGTLRS